MTNTHNDIQIGDRVQYGTTEEHDAQYRGDFGTVVSLISQFASDIRWDRDNLLMRHTNGYFHPAPIKVGDWVRVISVADGGNTDKIGHKFKVLEINHYGTVTEIKPDWGYGGTTWSPEHLRAIAEPFEPVEVGTIKSADGSIKVDMKHGAIFFDMAAPMESWTVRNDLRWNTETGRLEIASQSTLGNVRWDEVPNYAPPETEEHMGGGAPEGLSSQIDRLAEFIMHNVTREPSRSEEGAVDCAIRIMTSYGLRIRELEGVLADTVAIKTEQVNSLNKAAELLRTWIAMKIPGTGDHSRHWLNKYAPKRPFKRGNKVSWDDGRTSGFIVGPAPTNEEPFEVLIVTTPFPECIGKFVTPALTDLRHVE